jgi:hypothetical protein
VVRVRIGGRLCPHGRLASKARPRPSRVGWGHSPPPRRDRAFPPEAAGAFDLPQHEYWDAREIYFLEPDQRDLGCPVRHAKIFRFTFLEIRIISSAVSSPRRGVGHRHCTLGWDAVDAAALCAPGIAGRVDPRERSRGVQDERCFNASIKTSAGGTWPAGELVEEAAYGEVVWSWHPLLMLSPRRRSSTQPSGPRHQSARRR